MKSKHKIIMESKSPNCNIKATVEEYIGCLYFNLYVYKNNLEADVRSWLIINYDKTPFAIDSHVDNPMLSADYCLSKGKNKKLKPKKLEIVWFEEGDGAALLYENDIICVMPSSANSQCPGYSKECVKESKFAYPLKNEYDERVHKSKEFWNKFNDEMWGQIQDTYIEEVERNIGKHNAYFAIDGGHWPPKAMITIEKDNIVYIVTIGVSVIPQPTVEVYYEDPSEYRRIEFGFAIKKDIYNSRKNDVLGYISGQTSLPWNQLTFVGNGHVIPCDVFSKFSYMLLLNADNFIQFPDYRGDRVNILWMVPILKEEKTLLSEYGCEYVINNCAHNSDISDLLVYNGVNKFKYIK